jgi:hypothetical protein
MTAKERIVSMPKPFDVALRSIKYLLLAFFVVMICRRSVEDWRAFGYWGADTPHDLYRRLFKNVSAIGHPRASGRLSGPE